jgi:23S rRNA (cytosine1962-C5)-methyltransferase
VIIFEDEHLLVVNKPPGWNTHSPSPYAGEGLYEWLKNSNPSRANLAIMHRLDKETSGVIVFTKTPLANKSLVQQFEQRSVRKKYLLLTDRETPRAAFTAKSWLVRSGEKHFSQPDGQESAFAETRFTPVALPDQMPATHPPCFAWAAEPATGRTHQIRVHAADRGFPVLGDRLYGGTASARLFLHSAQIRFRHPASGQDVVFDAPAEFSDDPRQKLRSAFIDTASTNAFRLIHGAADGWPGLYVDRLGDFLLAQSERELTTEQRCQIDALAARLDARGIYHKILHRQTQNRGVAESSPCWLAGEKAPDEFSVLENSRHFALRFTAGCSFGLFLDQRENRRRLLTGYVAPDFNLAPPATTLNAFAYTCGFSVCAALAGARVTSLDLSKKYLDWGRRNFSLNQLEPSAHEFIYGDAFEWFRRLAKKGCRYPLVILDPPTFSRSPEHGVFRAEKDYGKLIEAALPLVSPDGILFASANTATLPAERFLEMVTRPIVRAGRRIVQQHYVPQPPDFPIHRDEPAYLKTVWLRVA